MDAQTIAETLGGKRTENGWMACCPAHDDKNPSLSIKDGDKGRPIVHCFAGCSFADISSALKEKGLWSETTLEQKKKREEKKHQEEIETPKQAARRLTLGQIKQGFIPIAMYEYQDVEGNLLFYRVRLDRDGEKYMRPMCCNGSHWELNEPEFEGGKPLYRQPELTRNPNTPVWIVEGEKCVDALIKAGKVAVTSGAAGSARKANWSPLRGREVHIWADNDPAGFRYASDVNKQLKGITDRIHMVDVNRLGLSEKEDVADWLNTHSPDELSSIPIDANKNTFSGATIVCMADVQPEPIQWFWPSLIALGKVTLIAGDPGVGKSMLTVTLVAHVTRGAPWPVNHSTCPHGSAIMLSAEDDPADTIRPRLDAAGADAGRVLCLTMVDDEDRSGNPKNRSFDLGKDIEILDRLLESMTDCRLITIDPVSAYLGSNDSHNNAVMRALLVPLAALASKHKVAIVIVTHLNKSEQANILYRASGSLAFVAAARAVFAIVKDKDNPDRRLFLPIKNNLGEDKIGYAYHIPKTDTAPVVEWENETIEMDVEGFADKVADRKPRPREKAKAWLEMMLRNGPVLESEIEIEAKTEGHAWGTVKRAKKDLKIKSYKCEFTGQWSWKLPTISQDQSYLNQVAHDEEDHVSCVNNVIPFDTSDPDRNTKKISSCEEDQNIDGNKVSHAEDEWTDVFEDECGEIWDANKQCYVREDLYKK